MEIEPKNGVLEAEKRVVEMLTSSDAESRIIWLEANLTSLSRGIFQECVTKNNEEAARRLGVLKHCFQVLGKELKSYLIEQTVVESEIFPFWFISGLFKVLKDEVGDKEHRVLLDFPFQPKEALHEPQLMNLYGSLVYLKFGKEGFQSRMEPAFDLVKDLFRQGKIKFFFGNVACGNFDTALLASFCQAKESQLRLFQYSRKAGIEFGQEAGRFRTLDSEFLGADRENDGICLVDGICYTGASTEESIKGFLEKGFKGPMYVFISRGSSPTIISPQIELIRLFPPRLAAYPFEIPSCPQIFEVKKESK